MSTDLMTRCIDAYWHEKLSIRGISSRKRMSAVFRILADEIKLWAPNKEQAKICHLAVNEIADRLIEMADDDSKQA